MYFRRIKDLREDEEKLQKQIAIELKITRQQYGLYESGERTIPIEKLIKLAKIYRTSVDYIVELTDEKRPYPRTKERR